MPGLIRFTTRGHTGATAPSFANFTITGCIPFMWCKEVWRVSCPALKCHHAMRTSHPGIIIFTPSRHALHVQVCSLRVPGMASAASRKTRCTFSATADGSHVCAGERAMHSCAYAAEGSGTAAAMVLLDCACCDATQACHGERLHHG